MIPRRLALTNFMCYRQAEVDFSGIHVACLAGENGAGKSALLDAITWAIWGRARAKRDDELIRLGEDEMAVEFVFELGGQSYRILRRRKAGKHGVTRLDFQLRDGTRWRSISEHSVTLTEKKITRILRLDYETFINSAFLRQGRADEFTIKTAAERKRVLSDILGLDRWAMYEERAKEKLRAIQSEAEGIETHLREIEEELKRRPDYEAQLMAAQASVVKLSAELQDVQAAYQRIEGVRMELRHLEVQRAQLATHVAQLRQELSRQSEELGVRRRRLESYEQLLARAEEVEAGYAAYQSAVEQEQALGAKLRCLEELNARRLACEARISQAAIALQAERETLLRRIVELEEKLPNEALLREQEEALARLAYLTQLSESRDAARDDLARIDKEKATLHTRNETLRAEMKALKEKIGQLERAGAECPLCGQVLTEAHRFELLEQFRAEGRARGDVYRANLARLRELDGEERSLKEQIASSERVLRELPALQRQAAALAERIAQGHQAGKAIEEARGELARVERLLQEEDYAHEARAELARILEQAEALGYDRAAHEAARRAMAEKQIFAEQHAQLAVARAQADEERTALQRAAEGMRRLQQQIEEGEQSLARLDQRSAALKEQLKDATRIEAELQRVRGEEAAARQQLGAAQQRLEACKVLEARRAEKMRRRDELALEKSVYEELKNAFGVKGVPAMIIEAAIPEIEAEANRLLERISRGRMHVRFETQRETLAGEVRETLEIHIADELGTRPYENYSGGEQFRINFAIRVALARLLARRAGTQLQMLVVDEGFGTQDAAGREQLVEAINAIQDDFACMLVITHIDELKDSFPARIQVTRTADGSLVEVL
ncbi:MAG: SMC family ATPase [Anaerolineae bacterium]|nr:SMC family ATPase [Anaerolineae bacterium]